jgi:lysophospholipase L1-like esterase
LHTHRAPFNLVRFAFRLVHTAQRIDRREPIKIVAIGSSSTEGVGASTTAASYPSRLEIALQLRFPTLPIKVVNQGKGGQEAGDEVARFQTDVIDQHPTLVVWQIGTNAVWKHYDLSKVAADIRAGLKRLKDSSTDVVLMDLQYAPAVVQTPGDAERMIAIIAEAAKDARVSVFRRFALMAYWNVIARIPFEQMIQTEPDGVQLHHNDWSYAGVARALAKAIAEAATRVDALA